MPGGGVDEMQNVPQCKKRQQSWGEDSVVGVESEGEGCSGEPYEVYRSTSTCDG